MIVDTEVFKIYRPDSGPASPVVIDNPHSGRHLPLHFKFNCPHEKLLDFGDLHVEKLLTDIPAQGVPVLEAQIHRACLDLNRHEFEIDPADVKGDFEQPHALSYYTQSGMGVIPRRLGRPHDKPLTLIFNEESAPDAREIEFRFARYHRPYYKALYDLRNNARKENGFCVHLDMHSFHRRAEEATDDIILGDLEGTSCAPEITSFVAGYFQQHGFSVDFNGLFQGGALIQRTGNARYGFHALQIEAARDLYLQDNMRDYDPQKAQRLKDTLTGLSKALHDFALDHAAALTPSYLKTSSNASHSASSTGPKPRS